MVNSKQLDEGLSTLVIEEGDTLNSHDVVSLFTCTPIHKVLGIVKDRLDKGGFKEYKTTYDFNLQSTDVIELLDFILSTTYFTFRDKIKRQLFSAAMDSPVSPLAANIFMEYLEETAIAMAPMNIKP